MKHGKRIDRPDASDGASRTFIVMWSTAIWLAGLAALPAAQATAPSLAVKPWLGQEQRIEEQLKSAKITRTDDIGVGVTRPRRVHLEPSEPVESATWKVLPPGRRKGHWESYKSEIAAYELDKLLDMHMVPPAVERTIGDETGAMVMWIGGTKSVKELGGRVPSGGIWGNSLRQMLMFDNLIGNPDRNAGNILIGVSGNLILIDHSRAFVTDEKLPQKVERVDAVLWDRMKALTREDLARVLHPWMDDEAIAAVVERRDRMAAEVDKLVARKGRAAVVIQ